MGSDDFTRDQVTRLRVQIDAQIRFYDKLIKRMKHHGFSDADELWINGWAVKHGLTELHRFLVRLEGTTK